MADDTADQHSRAASGSGSKNEKGAERQVALRVLVYVFVTHLIAGFIWLLFYIGGHAGK
ncbi:DUF6126 family protein [Streptomyces sp. XH2]|uniref:DUF6126 family protein n=1 Tax=Streptomyces sp. XH2 TaxID=3412483 RepID=UPI003C7B195B